MAFDPDEYLKSKAAVAPVPSAGTTEPEASPYGAGATAGRVVTGAAMGLPELLSLALSPGRYLYDYIHGTKSAPLGSPTAAVREIAGVPELPADAPTSRRLLEDIGSAALSGGSGILKAGVKGGVSAAGRYLATDVAAPVVAAHGTGMIGEKLDKALGGEGNVGRTVGALAGGFGYKPVLTAALAGRAKPNVAEVSAAANRLDIEPTYGMLAKPGPTGQFAEKSVVSTPAVAGPRQAAIDKIGDAVDVMINRTTQIPRSTPQTADYISIANQVKGVGGDPAAAVSQVFANRMRARGAEVDVRPTAQWWSDLYDTSLPQARSLEPTMGPMMTTAGPPRTIPGTPPPPAGMTPRQLANYSATTTEVPAPYSQVQAARSTLGARLPGSEGITAATKREAYGRMTDDMRRGAVRAGETPEAFDLVNQMWRNKKAGEQLQAIKAATVDTESATAMKNLALKLAAVREGVDPETMARRFGGAENVGRMRDIETVAGAIHYPTNAGGLAASMKEAIPSILSGAATGGLAHTLGTSPLSTAVLAAVPVAGRYIKGGALSSPMMRDYMLGRTSVPTPSIEDLLIAIQAAEAGRRGLE